jgi:hypothetical protein
MPKVEIDSIEFRFDVSVPTTRGDLAAPEYRDTVVVTGTADGEPFEVTKEITRP